MSRILILLTVSLYVLIQPAFAQTGDRYWISFTDKNNSPYSLSNPQDYLSQRAIDRRIRQQIPLDSTDLPVNPAYLDSIRNKGATIRHTSKWLNGATIQATPQQLIAIQALPFVKGSLQNGRIVVSAAHKLVSMREMPAQRTQFTPAQYGDSYNQIAMHKGDVLHNAGFRGEGMLIAVFDAGFINVDQLACFDSLRILNKIKDTYDFVDLDNDVYGQDSHGTYVLGCMAGWIPGSLIGTAPKADYLLYRTENNVGGSEYQIEEDNWVAAAERADSAGVDVMNTSLSYTTFDNPAMNHTYADMDGNTARITQAADLAASKGIMVVVSAGNYGSGSWQYIGAPADGDSVLSVGAVDATGSRVGFSSKGPTADGRIKPNVMAQGAGSITCGLQNGTIGLNGTSFSGPIMAGLVTCLWQAYPSLTNMQLLQAIQQSASKANNPDNEMGYGIPDFQAARQALTVQDEVLSIQSLQIYPNPVKDQFEIAFTSDKTGSYRISLRSIEGKVVLFFDYVVTNPGPQRLTYALPATLESGLYFLEVQTGSSRSYIKLLKP